MGTEGLTWNQQSGPFLCMCAIEFVRVYHLQFIFYFFDCGAFTVSRAESVAGNAGAILVAFILIFLVVFLEATGSAMERSE